MKFKMEKCPVQNVGYSWRLQSWQYCEKQNSGLVGLMDKKQFLVAKLPQPLKFLP